MSKYQKNTTCVMCKIIRYFLLSVFLLVILAFIQNDKLHYLKFINSENAAAAILIIGLFIFIGKLITYLSEKNKN